MFQKGQSGNPGGRPKGSNLTARLRRVLEKDDGRAAEALIAAGAKAALKGDFRFWNAIFERVDGRVDCGADVGIRVVIGADRDVPQSYDDLLQRT